MRVAFRADASVNIGTGHVMRCLTLADTLRVRGAECQFVMRDLPEHLAAVVAKHGFAVSLLDPPEGPAPSGPPNHAGWAGVAWERDLSDTLAAIAETDWLIVDHYAFEARWQRGLENRVGRIMVIDDLADRQHAAALLLDQNLGRVAQDYDGLVPDTCRRLIGPRFALLRPEFAATRPASLARRNEPRLSHLMISLGGTDGIDATSTVLRALATADLPDDVRISVVMGSRAPALERVQELAARMPWPAEVLVDVQEMAALMAASDLAIGAGGSTTWERCCLGLPSIIVETAENQASAVSAMQAEGAALGTGPLADPAFGERLAAAVAQLFEPETSVGVSRRSALLCEGDGAVRIAKYIGEATWK
jgi:UDP-2,4-diacetamido-2,4,6-trideoxy-beta-L-altropyranose hydrolase